LRRARERRVFTLRDIVPHTVTADARRFDSSSLSPSAEWSLVAHARQLQQTVK
jgi:hypothetical protein